MPDKGIVILFIILQIMFTIMNSPRNLVQQRRTMSKFRIDTRFQKTKGAIHSVFKTKAQIAEMEKKRQAAEWNEWDLESMVRYKSIVEYNNTNRSVEVKTKQDLRMRMRYYATDLEFRGGIPKPMEHTISKELQRVGTIKFYEHVQDGDVCSLDLGLLLKYADLESLPPPVTLFGMMHARHHVLDDYSCGHLFRYFRLSLAKLLVSPHKDGALALYKDAFEVLRKMRESQQGHRATVSSFSYSQLIRLCGAYGKLDDALSLKFEAMEKSIPTTSQMYEGLLEAAVKNNRPDVAWKEWEEIVNQFKLYPTARCCQHMLDACAIDRDYEKALSIFNFITEKNEIAYTKLINCCRTADKAFEHLYEFLEVSDERPTLAMCNNTLRISNTHTQAEAVITILKERVVENDIETFSHLFKICKEDKTTQIKHLDRYWDFMTDSREVPSIAALETYLEALIEMPIDNSNYHPVELLGKGLAAYDYSARKGNYNESSFVRLFDLCARAGQFRVSKLLFRKMIFTNMKISDQHVIAVIRSLATTPSTPKIAEELQHLLEIPLNSGSHGVDTGDVVRLVLQLRASAFEEAEVQNILSILATVTSNSQEAVAALE